MYMRAGGGGGGDTTSGVEAGVTAANMASFAQSASYMKAAAEAGQFAVDPESGRALVDVFRKRQLWAEKQLSKMPRLAQEPELGGSPGANTYKPFFASLASDPDEGLAPQWQKFIQVLDETANAIEESMKNYQETDTGESDRINSISGQIYKV